MESVSKADLAARLLEYLSEVEATGEPLIVTDNGLPVLKVVPIFRRESTHVLFADVRGKLTWREAPDATTQNEWSDV